MPKVEMDVHNYLELGYKGLTLRITDNAGTQLGRLMIGRGGVKWFPKNAKNHVASLTWPKLLERILA